MTEETAHKSIIIVLGMHRSGTSVTARALQVLGVELGDQLLPPSKGDNEKGFWEDEDITRFDDSLLETLSSTYDRLALLDENEQRHEHTAERKTAVSLLAAKMESVELFGFKDPRTAILLPFWQTVFQELALDDSYVIAIRNPLSVANSLLKRNDIPLEKGVLLWAKHMSGMLRHTQGKQRVVVDYDLMLESPSLQIQRIASALSLPFDEFSRQRLDLFEKEFISRGLRHHTASLEELEHSEFVPGFIKETYAWLLKLAQDEVLFGDIKLEKFWLRFEELFRSFNAGYQYMDRLELSVLQQEAAASFYKDENSKLTDRLLDEGRLRQGAEDERDRLSGEIKTVRRELDESRKWHQLTIDERDTIQKSYQELHQAHNHAVAERDVAKKACQEYAHDNILLRNQMVEILDSHSWQITRGLREIRRYLITRPHLALRRTLSNTARAVWAGASVRPEVKSRMKRNLFLKAPFLFRHTIAYRDWLAFEGRSVNTGASSSRPPKKKQLGLFEEEELYVPLRGDAPLAELPVRLIAFYLPQFHAIAENNEWWGEGFTEWSNVEPAEPQFEGHYQPHVPGELGYYDLSDTSVQKRQVELAKQYGVGGFCFYFYWFAGKRLLEMPILNYLNDASMDLPFCLCWANENWSRSWDGLDSEILIAQKHSPDDDIAFIDYVARYLRDPRYIRIDGRPLLLVYRPSLLPNPKQTAGRWRQWCRDNGIGEIYLAYTQSFEAVDPAQYGLDAAIEFPPNNSAPPNVTDSIDSCPVFSGIIYDWQVFPERSRNYAEPGYTLFRAVNTAWDNTARRKNSGAIFLNSTPQGYQEWLSNAVNDTLTRFKRPDERLVFINAWNEWAEGAHLEPDQRYGYAYLQATRDAIADVEASASRRIVLVGHDAHPHGAQTLLLYMARMLVNELGFHVDLVLLGDGPLLADYEVLAQVHLLHGNRDIEEEGARLAELLYADGIRSAIANTAVSGHFAAILKQAGFTVVSLIHELPGIIEQYQLQSHVAAIADSVDHVVFAAQHVMDGFKTFSRPSDGQSVIRPQGVFRSNAYRAQDDIDTARKELRTKFNLPNNAQIVVSIGYADHRKGVDLFVESGISLLHSNHDVYFIWVGHFDSSIESDIRKRVEESGNSDRFIFPGLDFDADRYYAGSDVYALTSREDPFPSVVLESLDAALPIIAFEGAGGFCELLSRGGGILVPAFDLGKYTGAIARLLDNKEIAQLIGESGRKIVKDEFSFRRYMFDIAALASAPIHRVSVVIPNYNYGRYLEARIESAVKQSYPVYELIILDDRSSDNSHQLIEAFVENSTIDCKVIYNEVNSGNPFQQWLAGVKQARGDLLWIAEADDLANAGFLAEVQKPFEDASVVMSYCQSKQINSEGHLIADNYLDYASDISSNRWTVSYVENGFKEISDCLAIKNTIPNVSAVLFRLDALSSVLEASIDKIAAYRVAGDWLTYIYVLEKGKIAYSPLSLNYHRRHDDSVTITSFDISQLKEILSVQKHVRETYGLANPVQEKADAYAQKLYQEFDLQSPKAAMWYAHPDLCQYREVVQ